MLAQFQLRNITKMIDLVDISDLTKPVLFYEDRFMVLLNSNEDLSRRLSLMQSAIAQLADGDAGTLEIEGGESNVVFFSPN